MAVRTPNGFIPLTRQTPVINALVICVPAD